MLLITVIVELLALSASALQSNSSFNASNYPWYHQDYIEKLFELMLQDDKNIRSQCADALSELTNAIKTNRIWSLEFLDSYAKKPSGFLSGKFSDFGDYEQCLKSRHEHNSFKGKYCLLTINVQQSKIRHSIEKSRPKSPELFPVPWSPLFEVPKLLRIGVCIPSICNDADVQHLLKSLPLNLTLDVPCETADDSYDTDTLSTYSIASLTAVVALISLTVIGSLVKTTFWESFSIKQNIKNLFSVPRPSMPGQNLAILDGMRFFMIMGSQMVHMCTYGLMVAPAVNGYMTTGKAMNFWPIDEYIRNWQITTVIQFVISGFLSYNNLEWKLNSQKGNLNLFEEIFTRWLRTLPIMTTSVLIVLAWPSVLGSGPLYREGLDVIKNNCKTNGIWEIIGLGNFKSFDKICLPSGWAVNANFQLYVIFLPLIVLLHKKPLLGRVALGLPILINVLLSGTIISYFNLPPFADAFKMDFATQLVDSKYLHLSPHNYLGAYAMGIFIKHVLISNRIPAIRARKLLSISTWILVLIIFSAIYYIPSTWRTRTPSRIEEVIFGAFLRTLYASGISWFIYRMITSNGQVSRLLSSRIFAPAGKTFLCMYIGMSFFMQYDLIVSKNPMEWDVYALITRTTYNTVFGALVGLALYILVEAPFSLLIKSVLKKRKRKLNCEVYSINTMKSVSSLSVIAVCK